MNLTSDDRMYAALLSFVNRKLEVSTEPFSDSRESTSTPPFLMDIRSAPRELQEAAFQMKLIPYIPAYGAKSDEET